MSKKNRAALRRTLLTLSLVLVVAFAAVGGTIAWLTAESDVVTNSFSVGSVAIELDEATVNEYGQPVDGEEVVDLEDAPRTTENTYKLLPGHTYTKDPVVYIEAGSEPCYVYVKVNNTIEDLEAADNTIATQMADYGWLALPGVNNVFYFAGTLETPVDGNGAVDARGATDNIELPVFDQFIIADDANVSGDHDPITIVAYAVQSADIEDVQDAWTNGSTSWQN